MRTILSLLLSVVFTSSVAVLLASAASVTPQEDVVRSPGKIRFAESALDGFEVVARNAP